MTVVVVAAAAVAAVFVAVVVLAEVLRGYWDGAGGTEGVKTEKKRNGRGCARLLHAVAGAASVNLNLGAHKTTQREKKTSAMKNE